MTVSLSVLHQAHGELQAWVIGGAFPFYRRVEDLGFPKEISKVLDIEKKKIITLHANDVDRAVWRAFEEARGRNALPFQLSDTIYVKAEKLFGWLTGGNYTARYTNLNSEQMEWLDVVVKAQTCLRILMQMHETQGLTPYTTFVYTWVAQRMQEREDLLKWTRAEYKRVRSRYSGLKLDRIERELETEYHGRLNVLAQEKPDKPLLPLPEGIKALPFELAKKGELYVAPTSV